MKDSELVRVRTVLARQHEHFYHATEAASLPSIRQHGVDPRFEGERSSYYPRQEPKAIRFFTLDARGKEAGASVLRLQRQQEVLEGKPYRPALVRVKSEALLSRRFGPDHSFPDSGPPGNEVKAAEFLDYTRKSGVISAYEVLPPEELELCITDGQRFLSEDIGEFAPLLAVNLALFQQPFEK